MPEQRLSPSVCDWRDGGRRVDVIGRSVFVHESGVSEIPIVLIHGFPGSSHDWAGLVPHLRGRLIAMDLPGYGFSDKSAAASYSLFEQADVVEALLAALGVERCIIVAHDMGDTVTAELAARANAGRLGFAIDQIVLTNGSIFIDLARLTRGQRLTLRLPGRALPFPMPGPVLRRSLMESFTATAPPPSGAIEDLVAMIRHGRGDRLLPRLIRYIQERRVHQPAWTAGLVDFAGPLTLIWGEEDPIAVPAMTRRLVSLRPSTSLVMLPGVGHWPAIEAPEELGAQVRAALGLPPAPAPRAAPIP
ncbi:alpha/beta hydrolase [Aeromicrobium sp. A1-2]|uniref:alpha/beta fold hydrolase n=1 Tax=Aeromicrobium sp. A1-2 TaxID=2107713 RepID=UPI000E554677|nr:alpha/beta hydrolase [Aeromicrobium sp. A1-2]AXT83942.1 alpha/beta hydrolase [Aeromicrobium sp. A1-2]